MIHALHDRGDPAETHHRQVGALGHHANDGGEPFEVTGFRRSEWVRIEEREDRGAEIADRPDLVSVQVFSVIVVSPVQDDTSASETLLQLVQNMHASSSLHHREGRLNLPAELARAVAEDRNTEAALAVDEADDPLLGSWPFLLIIRTRRIVTGHETTVLRWSDTAGTARYSGFPANSQLHSRRHRREGQCWGGAKPRFPTLGRL